MGDYAESWIASKGLALKPSSRTWYADRLDKHVLPVLGDVYLDKLTHDDLRTLQANLSKRMAASSVNGVIAVVGMLLGDAVVEFDLPRNPRNGSGRCRSENGTTRTRTSSAPKNWGGSSKRSGGWRLNIIRWWRRWRSRG